MFRIATALVPLVFLACGQGATKPAQAASAAAPARASAAQEAAATRPESGQQAATVSGTVLETLDAAGYTYLRLSTPDGEIWAAVNSAKVEKGSTVTIANVMVMDGFESKTLKRKFERIVFGSLAGPGAAPAAVNPHAGLETKPAEAGPISVPRADGADGHSVAELFAQRAALSGKQVAVRGKVVKFNPRILGRNWIHLRDGSGSPEGKDNDITVTSQDDCRVGDVVLVRGTVHLDRDFGAGYTYSVILEDAKLSK
jgi:hypothetical protein